MFVENVEVWRPPPPPGLAVRYVARTWEKSWLVGLDELPATEPATGSGGFGYANDSEGEKGRTDMRVAANWLIEKLVIWSRKSKVLRNSMDRISDIKTRILVVFAVRKDDEILDVHSNWGHNRKGIQEVNLKSFDDITLRTFIVVIEDWGTEVLKYQGPQMQTSQWGGMLLARYPASATTNLSFPQVLGGSGWVTSRERWWYEGQWQNVQTIVNNTLCHSHSTAIGHSLSKFWRAKMSASSKASMPQTLPREGFIVQRAVSCRGRVSPFIWPNLK